MSEPKWLQFWESLLGEHECYTSAEFHLGTHRTDLERGMSCMRVYRNTDGTWSLMPNWFKSEEKEVYRRAIATTYETFNNIPEDIQTKLAVLMLKDPGTEWLTGIGKRVDDGVFWLEDG